MRNLLHGARIFPEKNLRLENSFPPSRVCLFAGVWESRVALDLGGWAAGKLAV